MTVHADIDTARARMTTGRDIPWLLRQWAERTPDKTFLVWEPFTGAGRTWSYGELARDVEAFAGALHSLGVRLGERVMLHLDNGPEFVIAWFACARLGAVAVSTNTRSVARDMAYFAEHAGVVAAVTSPGFAALVADNAPGLRALIVTDDDAGEPPAAPVTLPHLRFSALLGAGHAAPARAADPMANLGIQYTSGTTSRPKAVLWTHANGLWGAQMNALHMRLRDDDVTLAFLPLFHTNAQAYSMLGSMWVGATMVVQPRFSASRFWEVSLRHRCTWCSMIPFCVKAIVEVPKPAKPHHYRFWGPAVSLPEVQEAFGIATFGWWGMTETITHGITGDPCVQDPRMGIGRPSPGYDIAIRRPDGTPAQPGERGALFIRGVRGVSLFKEYFNNAEANAKAFDADGWFATGDMIRIDEAGNLFFSDRDKDMLKVGGENVAASEVEAVILETGWVRECAVVAQKHHMLDEVPAAFVRAAEGAPIDLPERLLEVCRAKLADFKVPRHIELVDDFPRSTLEKIAKNVLRERLPAITK
ncbi:MAG: AMP-binding protein [Rubrivivax sp.]|nr:AMP-binding protein [Rubrivivax sp.]